MHFHEHRLAAWTLPPVKGTDYGTRSTLLVAPGQHPLIKVKNFIRHIRNKFLLLNTHT